MPPNSDLAAVFLALSDRVARMVLDLAAAFRFPLASRVKLVIRSDPAVVFLALSATERVQEFKRCSIV